MAKKKKSTIKSAAITGGEVENTHVPEQFTVDLAFSNAVGEIHSKLCMQYVDLATDSPEFKAKMCNGNDGPGLDLLPETLYEIN